PKTAGGIVTPLRLAKLVSALFFAWVVSCSTTVSTSPGRKARLSETSVHGACVLNTPPASPFGACAANGSLSSSGAGPTGRTAEQPDGSAAASTGAQLSARVGVERRIPAPSALRRKRHITYASDQRTACASCCSMLSAADSTLVFISYVRWAAIISTISSTTCTLD